MHWYAIWLQNATVSNRLGSAADPVPGNSPLWGRIGGSGLASACAAFRRIGDGIRQDAESYHRIPEERTWKQAQICRVKNSCQSICAGAGLPRRGAGVCGRFLPFVAGRALVRELCGARRALAFAPQRWSVCLFRLVEEFRNTGSASARNFETSSLMHPGAVVRQTAPVYVFARQQGFPMVRSWDRTDVKPSNPPRAAPAGLAGVLSACPRG